MKELVEQELIELKKAKEQILAQLNAVNGAIQTLEKLIKKDKSDTENTEEVEDGKRI